MEDKKGNNFMTRIKQIAREENCKWHRDKYEQKVKTLREENQNKNEDFCVLNDAAAEEMWLRSQKRHFAGQQCTLPPFKTDSKQETDLKNCITTYRSHFGQPPKKILPKKLLEKISN